MKNYYASVNFGFERIAAEILKRSGVKNVTTLDSAVLFSADSAPKLGFLNNTFEVFRRYMANDIATAVRDISNRKFNLPKLKGTFRIIAMDRGKLSPVPAGIMRQAEDMIARQTGLKPFRAKPDVEFWVSRRADSVCFFMLRLQKHKPFDKTLRRGELRPDVADAMVRLADAGGTLLDPFGGSGAIAQAAISAKLFRSVISGDIDSECVDYQQKRFSKSSRVKVMRLDATALALDSGSVDAIVTDPPWGEFSGLDGAALGALYSGFVHEAARVLRPDGRLVLLSSARDTAVRALTESGFSFDSFPVKISGKDADIFVARRAEI